MAIFDLFHKSTRETSKRENRYCDDIPHGSEDPNKPSHKAIIYQSELDYMSRCILDYPTIETGGEIFGYWTATGVPVALYVIGPGRDAQHHRTSFVQDQQYLHMIGNELYRQFRLQHIGEWHSHHQLGLAHPSGGDVNTMQYGVGKTGFPRLLLCIGNCTRTHTTINPFNFHENTPREYTQAAWDIVDKESPFRNAADRVLNNLLCHPITRQASHGAIRALRDTTCGAVHKTHWLTESPENVETMKTFVSMVQSMYPSYDIRAEILETGEPLISLKDILVSIKLPYGFPIKGPVLLSDGISQPFMASNWEMGEEAITTTFGRWLAAVLPQAIVRNTEGHLSYPDSEEDIDMSLPRTPHTDTETKNGGEVTDITNT